jgi:hypothetical protein
VPLQCLGRGVQSFGTLDLNPTCGMNLMLPNFLIIGAARCGTTWMHENLRMHPDIFMPSKKELHFFDRDYDKGLDFYEQYFKGWSGQKAIGEATPAYLHGFYTDQDVAANIHRHLPNAKLIVSLRNPVERAFSHFMNVLAKHNHNVGITFEEKLQRLAGDAELVREGFYAEQMTRYYKLFPSDRVLVMLYDDLVSDPVAFLRQVYEFLDVEPAFQRKAIRAKINMSAGKRNLAKSSTVQFASQVASRLGLHELSSRLRKWNSLEQQPMNPRTRAMLVDIYRGKNRELERLINRDLSQWNRI